MRREGQSPLRIVPTTFPKANDFVSRVHRHHSKLPAGFAWFCLAVVCEGRVAGVAISGRPTNRNNDDSQTVEVLRLATDGTPNAASCLLGACARVSKAMGARRIITYTLTTEGGSSLRGAGWKCENENTGKSWWIHNGSRRGAVDRPHMALSKSRWGIVFGEAIPVRWDDAEPDVVQGELEIEGY